MTSLVEFLRARLDEDEERARFVQREQGDRSRYEPPPWRLSWHDEYDLLCIEPSRALAEVEAKRKLITQFEHYDASARYADSEGGIAIGLETAVELAAFPYASHREYDESWRP